MHSEMHRKKFLSVNVALVCSFQLNFLHSLSIFLFLLGEKRRKMSSARNSA